jgi:hypothetical protein
MLAYRADQRWQNVPNGSTILKDLQSSIGNIYKDRSTKGFLCLDQTRTWN